MWSLVPASSTACGALSRPAGSDADGDVDADGDSDGGGDGDSEADSHDPIPDEPGCLGSAGAAPSVAGFVDLIPDWVEWARTEHFQLDVSGDLACVNVTTAEGEQDGFRLVDISDAASPAVVGVLDSELDQGSWGGVALADRYVLAVGEPVGSGELPDDLFALNVFDISDVTTPRLLGQTGLPYPPQVVRPLDGETALVGLTGVPEAGLQLVSFADPSAPVPVVSVESSPTGAVALLGGFAVTIPHPSFTQRELRVFDVSTGDRLWAVGRTFDPYYDVTASATHVFASTERGIATIDLSDPASPRSIAEIKPDGLERALLAVTGDLLVAASGTTLHVIDVTDASAPVPIASLDIAARAPIEELVARRDRAYLMTSDERLTIVNLECELP